MGLRLPACLAAANVMMHVCPTCGSDRIRRSRRTELERGMRPLHHAYRCRKCGARFWQIASSTWIGIALLLAVVFLGGAWWLADSADDSEDPVAFAERLEVARQRNGGATYEEAIRHLDGKGVEQDLQQAVALLETAAQYGYAPAQHRLGLLLRDGVGVAADDERAMTWLRAAAEAGHAPAQLDLGRMYLDGRGTLRDPARAYGWLTLATAQMVPGASEARASALAALKPDEIQAAKAEARRLVETRLPAGTQVDF